MRRNVVGTNFTSQAVRNPTSCPTRAAAPVPRRGAVRAAAKASDRIQLGTSDLQVSVCCLGACMPADCWLTLVCLGSKAPTATHSAGCFTAGYGQQIVSAPTKLRNSSVPGVCILASHGWSTHATKLSLLSVWSTGTMTWGQQNTEAEAHAQLNAAWEAGINFLDTAEMYPVPPTAQTQGATDRCAAAATHTSRYMT